MYIEFPCFISRANSKVFGGIVGIFFWTVQKCILVSFLCEKQLPPAICYRGLMGPFYVSGLVYVVICASSICARYLWA